LKLDETRRMNLINNFVHKCKKLSLRFGIKNFKGLRPLFKKFSGLSGSRINEALDTRETLYMAYILKKKA